MVSLLRLMAEIGPVAAWAIVFIAAIIAVFATYVGIAMVATLRTLDEQQSKIRYQVFRDLLELFHRGRR